MESLFRGKGNTVAPFSDIMSHHGWLLQKEEMIELELSGVDRERLDSLIALLKDSTKEILVSCNEAARLIGKSNKTISAMLRDGRLTKETIGKSTGIRLSEIRAKFPAEMR